MILLFPGKLRLSHLSMIIAIKYPNQDMNLGLSNSKVQALKCFTTIISGNSYSTLNKAHLILVLFSIACCMEIMVKSTGSLSTLSYRPHFAGDWGEFRPVRMS